MDALGRTRAVHVRRCGGVACEWSQSGDEGYGESEERRGAHQTLAGTEERRGLETMSGIFG